MSKNIFSLGVKFIGASISYALTVYLSRYEGNEKLGYFSFLLSYTLIYLLVMKSGTDMYLMKWVSNYRSLNQEGKAKYLFKRLFIYHLVVGLLITFVGYLVTPFLFQQYFSSFSDVIFFKITVISVFFLNLHILNYEYLRGANRLVSYTFYHTASVFLITIISCFIFDCCFHEIRRKIEISYLLGCSLSFLLSFVQVIKHLYGVESITVEDFSIKNVLKSSFPFFSNNAVLVLIGTLDIFFLSLYMKPDEIGEYAIMVKMATFVSFPLVVFRSNFSPMIVSYTDDKKLQKDVIKYTKIVFGGTTFLFLVIFICLDFIKSFIGVSSTSAYWVFIVISFGFIISSTCATCEPFLQMLGYEKLYQKIMIIALVVNILLNIVLIPSFKMIGCAVSSFITLLFWNLVSAYYVKKNLGFNVLLISIN